MTTCSCTQNNFYWSATSVAEGTGSAFFVDFGGLSFAFGGSFAYGAGGAVYGYEKTRASTYAQCVVACDRFFGHSSIDYLIGIGSSGAPLSRATEAERETILTG